MNSFSHILLFIIILFIYIQITHQFKRSEDLEVYEMDYINNSHLHTVCDVKQPIVFSYFTEFNEKINADTFDQFNNIDMKIKNIHDYKNDDVDYVILPYQNVNTLFNTDKKGYYFTENNNSFIEESNLLECFQENDPYLKPHFTMNTIYDIQSGSVNSYTPLRYHTYYRHFLLVNTGKIRIKFTPWKSKKYLYPIKDYDNYEFRSPVDVWNTQEKYTNEMNKMKFVEIDVLPNHIIYIPSYWWYSIQYVDDNTFVSSFTYNSVMNCISNLNHHILYLFQQQNTKTKVIKTINVPNCDSIEQDTKTTTTETTSSI